MLLNLKIGRNNYEITEEDRFIDNGTCVYLTTQSKEKLVCGRRSTPKLSKRALKEIGEFQKVYLTHYYGDICKLFSLRENVT